MTAQQIISDSLSKKRARDRRAQQNVRDKRTAHVQALEQRIVVLENELKVLQQRCYSLCSENETLRSREKQIRHLVTSWTDHTPQNAVLMNSPADSTLGTADALLALRRDWPTREGDDIPGARPHLQVLPNYASLKAVQSPQPRPKPLEFPPPWSMTPAHLVTDPATDPVTTNWFALCLQSPDLVRASPDIPQPLELLFGSKTNFLANAINTGTRRRPCRDPERLAAGWLTYLWIKWMVQPSESRFSRLQDFQKPVDEQLFSPHRSFIDFIIWPTLRANLIRSQHTYDTEDVLGLFSCCLKVRWPWNEALLELDENGELILRTDFYNTFTRLEGWGLTRDFIDRFPSLFQGVNTASIQYELI